MFVREMGCISVGQILNGLVASGSKVFVLFAICCFSHAKFRKVFSGEIYGLEGKEIT
jgi:hypothetical protein